MASVTIWNEYRHERENDAAREHLRSRRHQRQGIGAGDDDRCAPRHRRHGGGVRIRSHRSTRIRRDGSMTLRVGFLGYSVVGTAHATTLARLPMVFPDAPAIERSVLVRRTRDAVETAADQLGFNRVETDWQDTLDDIESSTSSDRTGSTSSRPSWRSNGTSSDSWTPSNEATTKDRESRPPGTHRRPSSGPGQHSNRRAAPGVVSLIAPEVCRERHLLCRRQHSDGK